MKRITNERASERRQYGKQVAAYLEAHPWCQIWIASRGLDETKLIGDAGWCNGPKGELICAPRSTQIHHRNKCRGARLLDERWWMAAAPASHDFVERYKSWARDEGYLLPFQADADGKWGSGNQALETSALIQSKIL